MLFNLLALKSDRFDFCFELYLNVIIDYSISSEFHEESLSVSFSAKTLLFVVSFVRSSVTEIADASLSVEKLLVQLEKASKDLLSHITKLLQVIISLVAASTSEINRVVLRI